MNKGLKRSFQFCLLLFVVGLGGMLWLFVQRDPFAVSLLPVNEQHTIAESVKALQVSTSTADVILSPSQSDQTSIRLSGRVVQARKDDLQLNSEVTPDGTLHVEVRELREMEMLWTDNRYLQLEIFLPATETGYDSVHIQTSTGDIQTGALSAKRGDIRSSTGDILVGGFTGEEVELATQTGDIILENLRAALRAKSSTGDVEVRRMPEFVHDVSIATNTGDVELSVIAQPTSARLRLLSDTGDVRVDWPQVMETDTAPALSVETVTGDIWIQ
ncbi:DUF4097 family beta strand repeat-containing protein [Brevibacillus sp. TJ4]|uniref:DUF4097 family beta strand repeat-containing protein n=1 Tax=Brevibacillus sp. TJ4 TaxID=3234853 RepID=UPI003BA1AF9D